MLIKLYLYGWAGSSEPLLFADIIQVCTWHGFFVSEVRMTVVIRHLLFAYEETEAYISYDVLKKVSNDQELVQSESKTRTGNN